MNIRTFKLQYRRFRSYRKSTTNLRTFYHSGTKIIWCAEICKSSAVLAFYLHQNLSFSAHIIYQYLDLSSKLMMSRLINGISQAWRPSWIHPIIHSLATFTHHALLTSSSSSISWWHHQMGIPPWNTHQVLVCCSIYVVLTYVVLTSALPWLVFYVA